MKLLRGLQKRIFLKGGYETVEGEVVEIGGIPFKIGKKVFNPILDEMIPIGMGTRMSGHTEVREAINPMIKGAIQVGIYTYERIEGEKCAVVELMLSEF